MRYTVAIIGAVTLVAVASMATAQTRPARAGKGQGAGGWDASSPYGRMYNPTTVENLSGEVVKVERITPMRGMSAGIHLVLKCGAVEISVHLGPAWYIERQQVKLAPGDMIQVKGSRVTFAGKPAIIAAEIRKGDEVLKLRNDAGIPAWSGGRRG